MLAFDSPICLLARSASAAAGGAPSDARVELHELKRQQQQAASVDTAAAMSIGQLRTRKTLTSLVREAATAAATSVTLACIPITDCTVLYYTVYLQPVL